MSFNRIQAAKVKLWDFSAYFWNTPRILRTRGGSAVRQIDRAETKYRLTSLHIIYD